MRRVPDLASLFEDAKLIRYRKGEYILRAEDEPQGVYIVESGLVKSLTVNDIGERYIHMIYGSKEVFPLGWTLDAAIRHVHFQAIENTVVRRLSRERFNQLIIEGGANTKKFLAYMAYYLVAYGDRVQNLGYQYAGERLAYRLLFLGGRFGDKRKSTITLALPLTRDELADSVNLSRKSVQRELDKLIRKRTIEIQGRKIVILNYHKLYSELHDEVDFERWGLKR